MSYEPTNWKAGDTVTSAKLNKIEQGISENSGSSIFKVGIVGEEGSMRFDKTFKEIRDAMKNDTPAYVVISDEKFFAMYPIVVMLNPTGNNPGILVFSQYAADNDKFIAITMYAQTENDYPSMSTEATVS